MREYQIEDIKTFMNELLIHEKYDSFYLYEARVKTGLDYYISGKVNQDFYDSEELEALSEESSFEYISWKHIKNTVYDLMKGKRLPISFKLVLMFNRENITRLVEMNNLSVSPEDVGALFLNIYYEKGILTATTGTSVKVFSMDKTLEHLWDASVEKYYIRFQGNAENK